VTGRRRADPIYEFHVSREARDRYEFDERLFGLNGNVVFANYAASRRFAAKMNAARDLAADPATAVRAGDINAMGLIDETLHEVVEMYRQQVKPDAIGEALASLSGRLGEESLDGALLHFVANFPGSVVYRQQLPPGTCVRTPGTRQVVLEELLLLWLANMNPAFAPLRRAVRRPAARGGQRRTTRHRRLEEHSPPTSRREPSASAGPRLDAAPGAAGQEHLRLARPAGAPVRRPIWRSTRSPTRSSTASPRPASPGCG
jgi:hypothetical protein